MGQLTDLLQRALRLESRSFLIYVRDAAAPRAEVGDDPLRQALAQLIANEETYLDALLGLLDKYGVNPDLATSFDMEATHYHYLELTYLIQVVAKKLAEQLDRFREIYDRVADLDPGAAATLGKIARAKQEDLAMIQRFAEQVRGKQGTAKLEDNRTIGRD